MNTRTRSGTAITGARIMRTPKEKVVKLDFTPKK
jgi:hypothetical protein